MKELEYRVAALYMFKMVMQILNALDNLYKELDEATYCERKIERGWVKDNARETEYGVIPLTREQITTKVTESGYEAIIKTVLDDLYILYKEDISIEWINKYVDKYHIYNPELKHIFINCKFEDKMKLNSLKIRELVLYLIMAMNECLRYGIDDNEESNKLISFIAMNSIRVLKYFCSEYETCDLKL